MVEKTESLHEVFWISATDGSLLQEDENYPECLTAQSLPFIPDPSTQGFYRAFHTGEVEIHKKSYGKDLNEYALNTLQDSLDHFMRPVKDKSGTDQFRKIIVNSSPQREQMDELAKSCVALGMNVIVFNGLGGSASLTVYSPRKNRYPLKGQPLNQLLFYLYKKCGLEKMPLVVLGNRKVNRGLTFHYCPQTEVTIEGPLGVLSCGREGLVFTDVILGQIPNEATACQKAGRGAGLIANTPQYTGMTHYWTNTKTADSILAHNHMVDRVNQESGVMREVVPRAKSLVNHSIDEETFLVYKDEAMAYAAAKIVKGDGVHWHKYGPKSMVNGFIASSVGGTKKDEHGNKRPYTLIEAIKAVAKKSTEDRTYFPCYRDLTDPRSIHYVVLTLKEGDHAVDRAKVAEARRTYPPIPVPKTGKY